MARLVKATIRHWDLQFNFSWNGYSALLTARLKWKDIMAQLLIRVQLHC